MADGDQQRGRGPTFLDLVADYQATYGHRPDADMAWSEFVGLVQRADRYSARDLLTTMDAVAGGIANAFGAGDKPEGRAVRRRLRSAAYPENEPDPTERIRMVQENARNGA